MSRVQAGEGSIIPACGGTEPVFTVHGVRWQYVYQPTSGRHGYYCLDTDRVEWHRSFHPAFSPEYAGLEDELPKPTKKAVAKPAQPVRLVWPS